MPIISTVLSVAAVVLSILASLTKGKENIVRILIFMFLSNFSIAMSYVVQGTEGINGSITCFLGAVCCIINFFFTSNEKSVPLWLSAIYAVCFTVANFITGISVASVIAVVASLCFVMSIIQKNGAMFRIWSLSNLILWCIFDITQGLYSQLISHSILLIFYIMGMIINDRKSKN